MKYTKELLTQLYVVEKLSMTRIAKKLGAGSKARSYESVRQALIRHGIEIRPKGCIYPEGFKFEISKEDLQREYIDNGKTQEEIASMFGCGSTLIYNLMKKHNIPTRPREVALKGIKRSLESRIRMHHAQLGVTAGDKNYKWKGGVTTSHESIRKTREQTGWRRWILLVKGDKCERCGKDLNETCPCCGHRPDKHVHHVKPFSDHPDMRSDISNGLVLCESCHKLEHKK